MRDMLELLKQTYEAVTDKVNQLKIKESMLWQSLLKFMQSAGRKIASGIGILISIINENTSPLFAAIDNFIINKTGWHLLQNRFMDYFKMSLNTLILGYIMFKIGLNFPILSIISLMALSQWGEKMRAPETTLDSPLTTTTPINQTQTVTTNQNSYTPTFSENANATPNEAAPSTPTPPSSPAPRPAQAKSKVV